MPIEIRLIVKIMILVGMVLVVVGFQMQVLVSATSWMPFLVVDNNVDLGQEIDLVRTH